MRFLVLVGVAIVLTAVVYVLAGFVFGGGGPEGPPRSPEEFYRSGPREAGVQPVALTRDASELRRVREEHRGLIASIPDTPGPTPTLTAGQLSDRALARVIANPDGAPPAPDVDEDWFDPEQGLTFYRDSGGDWTPRRVREAHPYRHLFYHRDYPEGVVSFSDESIHRGLARELAFAGIRVMPMLEDPSPGMIDALTRSLGWEARDSPGPVINVWASFGLVEGGSIQSFAVGGVMRMGVRSKGEGNDMFQYLVPGEWVGSVVVERLG